MPCYLIKCVAIFQVADSQCLCCKDLHCIACLLTFVRKYWNCLFYGSENILCVSSSSWKGQQNFAALFGSVTTSHRLEGRTKVQSWWDKMLIVHLLRWNPTKEFLIIHIWWSLLIEWQNIVPLLIWLWSHARVEYID